MPGNRTVPVTWNPCDRLTSRHGDQLQKQARQWSTQEERWLSRVNPRSMGAAAGFVLERRGEHATDS